MSGDLYENKAVEIVFKMGISKQIPGSLFLHVDQRKKQIQ